jgi:hypothetical protein
VGLVVAESVVAASQTVVDGLCSEPRDLAAEGTWWVGLALTQRHQPSLALQVQVSNAGVQSSTGTERETGAVKQWEGGAQSYQQL